MSQDLTLLDTVVLTEDVPEHDLQRGHVGSIALLNLRFTRDRPSLLSKSEFTELLTIGWFE